MGAYAAKGDFKSAIETGEKALGLKEITEKPELAKKIEIDLAEYKKSLDSANMKNSN